MGPRLRRRLAVTTEPRLAEGSAGQVPCSSSAIRASIYRFRRADIDIYNIVRQRFSDPEVGRVLPLTLNFRSAPQLCNWAKRRLQTRFRWSRPCAPRFAPLDLPIRQKISGEVCTLTHTCDKGDVKLKTQSRSRVHPIRSRYRPAPVQRLSDSHQEEERPDRAVCARAGGAEHPRRGERRQGLRRLSRGAGAHGRCARGRSAGSASLIAVLRGPLFGISDPQLFDFKQRGGWFSVFQDPMRRVSPTGLSSFCAGAEPVLPDTDACAACRRCARASPRRQWLPCAGGDNAGGVWTPGMWSTPSIACGKSWKPEAALDDAADALEADREATSEVESLPLEPGRTDVVRLMNLHKAKGLEANVVFLADPLGGVSASRCAHRAAELKARGWLKLVRRSETSCAETCLVSTPTGARTKPPNFPTYRLKNIGSCMLRRRVPGSCWSSAGGRGMRTTLHGEFSMASWGRRANCPFPPR